MFDFIMASENTIFNIAIGIVLALGLLEGLGLMLGLSLLALFDQVSPIDLDFEVDANMPEVSSGGLTQILGWLCLNRLPLLIWLVLFLSVFGILGYVANFTLISIFGNFLPSLLLVPIVLIVALILCGRIGHRLANILPKNESSAISSNTFGGHVATITTGTARKGSAAEASFVDNFKQKHYVMVEPMDSDQTFATGDEVILVEKGSNAWQVVSAS